MPIKEQVEEVQAWRGKYDGTTGDPRLVLGQWSHIKVIAESRAKTDALNDTIAPKTGGEGEG